MERIERKPFQGVTNIIRFNWHFYVIAFSVMVLFIVLALSLPSPYNAFAFVISIGAFIPTLISLLVSWYIYDQSDLYSLSWLDFLNISSQSKLVNINAGFDETSFLLKKKYPAAMLTVLDFYNPYKHTEISIERARKAYSAYPETIKIDTLDVNLLQESASYIFLILAAHEIRKEDERIYFFKQLKEALSNDGKIIITEHLRDINNCMAYNFGVLHFFSRNTWKKTFTNAGLLIEAENNITPFITIFILSKNGSTS